MSSYIGHRSLRDAQQQGTAPWTDEAKELSDYHVAVFRDAYPVAPGHLLFVPCYDTPGVIKDAFDYAYIHGLQLKERGEIQGFNIGMNMGAVAGQTVMYPHIHFIPRSAGDCADPVGGVRGVIPGQANYKNTGYKKPECF